MRETNTFNQMVDRSPAAVTEGKHLGEVFRALADPTRRGMLRALAAGQRTILELAEPYVMSFSAASKHVRVLERAGPVLRTNTRL